MTLFKLEVDACELCDRLDVVTDGSGASVILVDTVARRIGFKPSVVIGNIKVGSTNGKKI